jgi:hypothetical protein
MIGRFITNGWRGMLAVAAGAAVVVGVSGCGGAGAGAGGGATLGSGATAVADIQLMSDKVLLPSAGGSATITAQVKNASNNVLANQAITFVTADSGVALTPSGPITDAGGKATAKLDLGGSATAKANRTVTVTVTSGTVVRTIDVQVSGTTLAISGPQSVTAGSYGDFTVSVLDSAGNGIPNVAVTGLSSLGNVVTPATATTASSGQAKLTLSGSASGSDSLTVSALGMNSTRSVGVTGGGTSLQLIAPAPGAELDVNLSALLRAQYLNGGSPVPGATVTFTSTRGLLNGTAQPIASAVTDATGIATVSIQSASAGIATLTATQGATLSATGQVEFVSRTPAKITLSPSPTSIGSNAPNSTSSQSQLIAVVRDATDNPVKGVTVAFSAPNDPSSGSIQPGISVTDSAGMATAAFIAGPNSTGPGAVQVQATVVAAPSLFATSTMTVSSVALFVELGTGNSIEALDATSYRMPWAAIVTDSNRNPVAGAKVTVSLAAISYYKGVWAWGGTVWTPTSDFLPSLPLECASEDLNENNLIDVDAGEDFNGNNKLDPGSPASVMVTSPLGETGSDGRALIAVVYPRSFGSWVKVRMRVTIATTGTESSIYRTFVLPMLASDVNQETSPPPNVGALTPVTAFPPAARSGPYGYALDTIVVGGKQFCTSPN